MPVKPLLSALRGGATLLRLSLSAALTGLFGLAHVPSCSAQVDRSGLTGTVTDATGRVVVQAHITTLGNTTGLRRETVSDSHGVYTVPELPVGVYTVTVDHPGFSELEFSGVEQVIGRIRVLNAILAVAGGEERVEVSTGSALLDRSSAAVTGLIERKQADELPLNGRNWSELTAFIPGAIDTGGSNQRSVRFAGRGLDDSNFTFDGIDATNVVNQTQRPWVRLAIPLDAIAEFRVDTLLPTAEAGATGGAQLAVSSPSGTNQLHGRLFEFIRNDAFDAPLPLWGAGGIPQQPLRLNQFGGSLGGPIVHDRTFLFLASEAYRQNWGYPTFGQIPSAALIATVPNTSPVYALVTGYPKAGPKTFITPTSDANIDQITCACSQVVNEGSALLRLDHQFSSRTSGFLRFSYDRAVNTQPYSAAATDVQQRVSTPVSGTVELLHIFSPALANEAQFGFNRATSNQYNFSASGSRFQIVVASPSTFVTQNYSYNSIYVGNSFSGIDNATLSLGRQTLKFGGEIRHIQLNQNSGQHGKVTFASVEQLAANAVSRASLTGALPVNDLRKNDVFGYLQDEWKVRPNLTLNLGLRYSFFQLFNEAKGQANPFDFDTCGPQGFCGIGASFGQQHYADLDPRLAFAWSPGNAGKLLVRGGFGTYHEDGQLDDQNLPAKNEIPSYSVKSSKTVAVTYPVESFFGTGALSPNAEQRTRKDSYVEQWDLSVQGELPARFVGTVSYLGSHGVHLLDQNVVNLEDPGTGVPQYPGFAAAIPWRGSIGASSYNGLSVAMRRQFSNGLLVAANYAYTHELDNGSNGSGDGDELPPQNAACLSCEWASGAWDATHVLNGNAVYELPFGLGKQFLNRRGLVSSVAGNWQMTTTALARTGFPVNVLLPGSYTAADGNSGTQRPDLVPGVSLRPTGGRTVAHWINPLAFQAPKGEFGNAPRNLLRGPGTYQIDLGAAKTFPFSERARIQLRSDFFNVFNHPQLGQPQSTCSFAPPPKGSTAPPSGCTSGFGSIINTINLNTALVSPITPVGSGTPREMQFALRFDF